MPEENHHVLHLFLLAPLRVRRFVPRGEERGEMAVFTGYFWFNET